MLATSPAGALTLAFPAGASLAAEEVEPLGSQRLPSGPFSGTEVPVIEAEGAVIRRAWRIGQGGSTTLQVLAPLRDQIVAEGYEIVYECADRACGGFDFRYALDLLPEPEMHVDLGDFRYLLASRQTDEGRFLIALTVSRDVEAGFVHVTRVQPAAAPTPEDVAETAVAFLPESASRIADALRRDGYVILEGLEFGTGSSDLGNGRDGDLEGIARFLKENPEAVVALVGHTDAVGPLDRNVDLSRRRAASVRGALIADFGVPARQMVAEGVGFLAPRASNLTEEGRSLNRRVEAVLLNTE